MAWLVVVVEAPRPRPLARLVVGPRALVANPRKGLGRPTVTTDEAVTVARTTRRPFRTPVSLAATTSLVRTKRHGHATLTGVTKADEPGLMDPHTRPPVRLRRVENTRPTSPVGPQGTGRSRAAIIAEDTAT